MKKFFKLFLNNIALIGGAVLGMILLYTTIDFISSMFTPLIGMLVLVLLIALALSILTTILEIFSEDMEEVSQKEELD